MCTGWRDRVARVVRELGEDIVGGLRLGVHPSGHLIGAFLGRGFRWSEQVARRVATLAGAYAPRILRAALESCGWRCRDAGEPFDYYCCRGRSCYYVKVVSGEKAFNSTTQRALERAAADRGEPCLVLTVQGYWRGSHERPIGPCRWLDAVATWRLATGYTSAYREFLDVLYQAAEPYRRQIQQRLSEISNTTTRRSR